MKRGNQNMKKKWQFSCIINIFVIHRYSHWLWRNTYGQINVMFPYKSVNQSIRIECSIRYLPVLGSITAFNLTWLRLDFEFDFSHFSSQRIRSLSNDDEDGNENVKTSSVSRLFVNLILCRPCMTTTWNCLYSRLEFKSRRICQQLTNWTIWNKLDQVWSSVNSFLKWRFRSRGRRS